MSELFDDIARVLAGPLPRRRALFQAAGLLAGAALAGLRPAISQADTVCCDPQTNRCCPPGVACCGLGGPQGAPNCCAPGQTCCNPATGACCSPGEQCCHGACISVALACCQPTQQACGRLTCCNTAAGQTCCDSQVGLCCPAGQVCLASGNRSVCGQPCGSTNGIPKFCVNGEVCCGSVCCPRGQACCNGRCQPAGLGCDQTGGPAACPGNLCPKLLTLPAHTAGDSQRPDLSAWLDTGIDLVAGCGPVIITAAGIAQNGNLNTTPDGVPFALCSTPTSTVAADCSPTAGIGALIGVVGTGLPFKIGAALNFSPSGSGRLRLAYNDKVGSYGNNSGSYQVTIVYPC